MKVEIRSEELMHVSGYANVPGRLSRPVFTPRGQVIETIKQGAFADAIKRAKKIDMVVDHGRVVASTEDGTLKVKEDNIGMYVESEITDKEIIKAGKANQLKGWSFLMSKVQDTVEARGENELPLRTVTGFDLEEITLCIHMRPFYSATSVEARAEGENNIEERGLAEEVELIDHTRNQKQHEILKKIKGVIE